MNNKNAGANSPLVKASLNPKIDSKNGLAQINKNIIKNDVVSHNKLFLRNLLSSECFKCTPTNKPAIKELRCIKGL